MTHAEQCERAARAALTLAQVVHDVDPATPVPTCPGWDVHQLVAHVGAIHRWTARMVAERSPVRMDRSEYLAPGLDLAAWLAEGAEGLRQMAAADPDAPMWAWGADRHVRFWPRRMVHETTVHTADVLFALGRPVEIEADVAVDGIDELLDNLPYAGYFAPRVANLRGEGSLHFHGTHEGAEWMIELHPEGYRWTHAHGKGTVAVRGATTDLLLLAYGRYQLADPRFEVFGDRALAERWLADSAI